MAMEIYNAQIEQDGRVQAVFEFRALDREAAFRVADDILNTHLWAEAVQLHQGGFEDDLPWVTLVATWHKVGLDEPA